MKKLLAFVLAIALIFSLSATASAANKADTVTVGDTTYVLSKGITDTVSWGNRTVYLVPKGTVVTCADSTKKLAFGYNEITMWDGEAEGGGGVAEGPYDAIDFAAYYLNSSWDDSENWDVIIPFIGVFDGYEDGDRNRVNMTDMMYVCEDNGAFFPGFTPHKDPNSVQFADVKAGAYYAAPVTWAILNRITDGTSGTTFSPDLTCTNAHILTFLWRACGSRVVDATNTFSDVKESDYFYQAALWAKSMGMITSDKFSPNTPCTRASAVLMIWKARGGSPVSTTTNFTDVPANSEYATAVAWAVENGITDGTSKTTFSPDRICTRAQIVTFLYRGFTQ